MSHGLSAATATTPQQVQETATESDTRYRWWINPYFMGCLILMVTAVLAQLLSLLMIHRKLHLFHYCSLFLVEMAVGCLTTEAIVHMLPGLIVMGNNSSTRKGMPAYFPHLATVTAIVCLLHTLDTASIVFFGRRQSTSHAIEYRNSHHQRPVADPAAHAAAEASAERNEVQLRTLSVGETIEIEDSSSVSDASVRYVSVSSEPEHEGRRTHGTEVTLRQALARPRLFLQPGPYSLCTILTAGALLHSFADGVAIGAAFVKSWEYGLQLSLSVCIHELAHKVADFSVLSANGFAQPAVIMLNICYWLASTIGLLVSVPLSQRSEALRAWIMTIATGVFVYISLVTMSSMVRRNYLPEHISAFIIGNFGMTFGYAMIVLASMLQFLS